MGGELIDGDQRRIKLVEDFSLRRGQSIICNVRKPPKAKSRERRSKSSGQ